MKITTQDIIKVLPFEEDFKKVLADFYGKADADRKFNLEQMLWDTYFTYFQIRLDENIELAMEKAKDGQEKLDGDFYKRVRMETQKQIENESIKKVTSSDLDSVRAKLQSFLQQK